MYATVPTSSTPPAGHPRTLSAEPADTATVSLRAVTIRRGAAVVLQIERLDLFPGVTALIGPYGSGKSTLLHAIAGLLPATGEISVFGTSPKAAQRRVAYVLQAQHASEHLLVTAGETVALGRAALRGALRPLRRADRQAIAGSMRRLDIDVLRSRHLAEMSGGQRQRVFVAQGLAQRAPLLLLDEPVAGLDVVSTALIRDAVAEERAKGHTVVIATHDLAEASRADRVVILNRQVVAAGRPSDVLTPEALRAAYGHQVLDLGEGRIAVDDGVHHDDHEHHHHDHHPDDHLIPDERHDHR